MKKSRAAIIREPDDPLAEARISLGSPRSEGEDFYFVFRGEPEKVLALLEKVMLVVKVALPEKLYDDRSDTS